ncbi:cytochrome P450 [Alphaproteobacteria bacterium]|nr:cytochrome P450 [Alphaproteobacteria bacterium]
MEHQSDLPLFRPAAPVPPTHNPKGVSWFQYLKQGANPLKVWNDRMYYQPVYMVPLGPVKIFHINDPDITEQVLQDKAGRFIRSRIQADSVDTILGKGLLAVDGDEWKEQRRILAPVFQPHQVAAFEDEMRKSTQSLITKWTDKPPKRPIDIIKPTSQLTLDFIANALFGGLSEDNHNLLSNKTDQGLKRMPWLTAAQLINPFKSINRRISEITFRRQISLLDQLAEDFVDRYRRDPKQLENSLLARVVEAQEAEGGSTDKAFIRDQTATFLLAGHETTGKALAFTLYCLSVDKARRAKLVDELDSEGENSLYLDYVIKEALRLYPPAVIISRDTTEEMTLGDRDVPKGSTVMISPWLSQRNTQLWEQSDKFWPERWENEVLKGSRRYSYLPFGGGPRVCIGMGLALTEMKIMLAALLQNFTFDHMEDRPVEPEVAVTLGSKTGIWMEITQR